jgi:hypothetical protein
LRRSYREDGKVKKETLANLSGLEDHRIAVLRSMLAGKELVDIDSILVERSMPHGHVEAILSMMGRLNIASLLDAESSRQRDLVVAMIAQRIVSPGSKLFTTRVLQRSTLAEELHIGSPDADDLYGALDWLIERQPSIEQGLAKRHLQTGGTALYDLSSSYFEGRTCPWRCAATRVINVAGPYNSSTDYSAIAMADRWQSRRTREIRLTHKR